MNNPILLSFLLVLILFAIGATLFGLLLERAVRFPGIAAGMVVVAVIGLSWGGVVLIGQ